MHNVMKDFYFKWMLFFWTYSKNPEKMYHSFHKNIKQQLFKIDNNYKKYLLYHQNSIVFLKCNNILLYYCFLIK